jgi:hypothetical protein
VFIGGLFLSFVCVCLRPSVVHFIPSIGGSDLPNLRYLRHLRSKNRVLNLNLHLNLRFARITGVLPPKVNLSL